MTDKHLPKIIGLHGYAGVGKSKIADYLSAAHGYTLVKFAGPLKGMLRSLGLGHEEIEGSLKEKPSRLFNGKSPREAMQSLGTEWGRANFGDEFWVNLAMERVFDVIDAGGCVVLDDCRFDNEAMAIQNARGVVLKVTRPGVGPVNGHASDNQLVACDAEIGNSGSLVDLCDAVDFTLEMIADKRKRTAPFAARAFVL